MKLNEDMRDAAQLYVSQHPGATGILHLAFPRFLLFCSARLHVGVYFSLLDTGLLAVGGLTVFGTQDK